MATQERECVALGPGAASERPFEKPRVTALAREERLDPWRADDGLLRQRGGRDERVVDRIDQETRASDPGLHVHAAVVEMGLGPDLGLQAAQELGRIERPGKSPVEGAGASGEIERRGDA